MNRLITYFFLLLVTLAVPDAVARKKLIDYRANDGSNYGYEEAYRNDGVWMVRFIEHDLGPFLPKQRLSIFRAAEFGIENGYKYMMIIDDHEKYSRMISSSDHLDVDPHSGYIKLIPGSNLNMDDALTRAHPIYVRYANEVDCTTEVCAPPEEPTISAICSSRNVDQAIRTQCDSLIERNIAVASDQEKIISRSSCHETYRKTCSVYKVMQDDWIDELSGVYYPISEVKSRYQALLPLKRSAD